MNILLINPPQHNVVSPAYMRQIQEEIGYLPPLGLIGVASHLAGNSDHRVQVLDAHLERWTMSELEAQVATRRPDVVGITALTFLWIDVLAVAQAVRRAAPQARVVLGGPHTALFPAESLHHDCIDYLVLGEGEEPFLALVETLAKGMEPENLAGVIGRVDLAGGRHRGRYFHPDCNRLAIPDRKLTPYQRYVTIVSTAPPTTTLMSSRGCPSSCIFCFTAGGKRFRPRSVEHVVNELTRIRELNIREVFFFDECFTLDRQRVMELCAAMRSLDLVWMARARADQVDEQVLAAMKAAGCTRIQFGIESGHPQILKNLGKGITVEDARRALRQTRAAGLETYADFMIGCPGEREEHIQATLRLARELDPDYVYYSILIPYPHTRLYRLGQEQGLFSDDYWRAFVIDPQKEFVPRYWEENFNAGELEEWMRRAFRSFCFHPRYIWKSIRRLTSSGELWRKIKGAWRLAFKI